MILPFFKAAGWKRIVSAGAARWNPSIEKIIPMDALTALHTRQSTSQLGEPGPSPAQLDNILKAGLRANDHGRLRPWHFLLIEGDARRRLGELFVRVTLQDKADFSREEQEKLAAKALRAPLIIVVVARLRPSDKIPEIEQRLSAAAAAQLMMAAAHAQGIGAVWRTGSLAYDRRVHTGLGLEANDHIVGFLYMGTPRGEAKPFTPLDVKDFVRRWT